MKERFQKLYDNLKLDRKHSEWSRIHDLESRYKELKGEVEELEEAIHKKDKNEIKDEFGDVLWDLISCAIIAEDMGIITLKEIFDHANEKIQRRKPWVFEMKSIPLEEEKRRYQEIKQKEKNKKQ